MVALNTTKVPFFAYIEILIYSSLATQAVALEPNFAILAEGLVFGMFHSNYLNDKKFVVYILFLCLNSVHKVLYFLLIWSCIFLICNYITQPHVIIAWLLF